jgi:hypothetical protein
MKSLSVDFNLFLDVMVLKEQFLLSQNSNSEAHCFKTDVKLTSWVDKPKVKKIL